MVPDDATTTVPTPPAAAPDASPAARELARVLDADGGPAPDALHTALEDALDEAVATDVATGVATEVATDVDAGRTARTAADDLLADWAGKVVAAYPRPSYPLASEWDASVQGLVRLVPLLPRFATAPLGLLDRFGAVTVGPERVGLDGTDVDWSRVVEIRTEPAWTCLSAAAFEADLARFVTFVPPVPGRGWLLRRVSELLMSLYLAVLPVGSGDDGADGAPLDALRTDPALTDGVGLLEHVVTSITYTRRWGQGEATVSVPSALLQLALPGTADAVVRTARQHGVTVTHVPAEGTSVGAVITRGETWRRTALDLRDDLTRRWRP
ncbi:hypothetical protein AB6N23_02585 [Cellulomonas sp. 179-A 9B4 NHS]|uniref:hypothetical protein n=1 Tax=Cellulomonas sp. 179-A 9B4 NHS TaxID=3142379 RepID=UPI0039A32D3D